MESDFFKGLKKMAQRGMLSSNLMMIFYASLLNNAQRMCCSHFVDDCCFSTFDIHFQVVDAVDVVFANECREGYCLHLNGLSSIASLCQRASKRTRHSLGFEKIKSGFGVRQRHIVTEYLREMVVANIFLQFCKNSGRWFKCVNDGIGKQPFEKQNRCANVGTTVENCGRGIIGFKIIGALKKHVTIEIYQCVHLKAFEAETLHGDGVDGGRGFRKFQLAKQSLVIIKQLLFNDVIAIHLIQSLAYDSAFGQISQGMKHVFVCKDRVLIGDGSLDNLSIILLSFVAALRHAGRERMAAESIGFKYNSCR